MERRGFLKTLIAVPTALVFLPNLEEWGSWSGEIQDIRVDAELTKISCQYHMDHEHVAAEAFPTVNPIILTWSNG